MDLSDTGSPRRDAVAVVLLAGVVPWLVTLAATSVFGETRHLDLALHEAMELAGACIAFGVATLLLLRARHEAVPSHVPWVTAALVAMGLLDAAHAVAPEGAAWSWLRHVATLAGGVLFGLVWVPLRPRACGGTRRCVGGVAVLAAAMVAALGWRVELLPAPWGPGGYTLAVKVTNALGGIGFLAAAVYFLRAHGRERRVEHLVFASHTLLFGAASLLFGFSQRWAADWWAWHALRLLAYAVVIVAAYEMVVALYQRIARDADALATTNRALQAENVERRIAEAELQRHQDRLEDLVDERTEALREADRRKDEFLAVLSHELRNPLAPIANSLHVLEREAPRGEQARRAQAVIARQVRQLSRLVEDLLDVTRMSRDKVRLSRARIDLDALVQRTVEDHAEEFERAGVALGVRPAGAAVPVDGDPNRLAQVIGNLLMNAAKFTPRGGRTTVTVRADRAAGRAEVHVEDTGVGIAPDVLPRLFQPFVQADMTLERAKGGLGLGLALVKGIVELHGGEIEVRSAGAARGSEFVVRLPLEVDPGAPAPAPSPAEPARPRPRRVLVIEDNVDAAETLRDALELRGHEVAVAHDGPAGLDAARALRPEIVLCDIGLPRMDGYEVARAFRADPALSGAVLVALSGYAAPDDVARASQAGFARHLAKPSSLDALDEVIASLGASA